MAKYTIDTIRENQDFLEFAKNEYNYNSFDDIPLWEQNALFYKFKAREGDLEENDFSILSGAEKDERLEEIAAIYYPDIAYDDLAVEDIAFTQAMALTLNQPNAPSLDQIKEGYVPTNKMADNETPSYNMLTSGDVFAFSFREEDHTKFSQATIRTYPNDANENLVKFSLNDEKGNMIGYAVRDFGGGAKSFGEVNGKPFEIETTAEEILIKSGELTLSVPSSINSQLIDSVKQAAGDEEITDEQFQTFYEIAAVEHASLTAGYIAWHNPEMFRQVSGKEAEENYVTAKLQRSYNKDELQAKLTAYNVYLLAPEQVQNKDLLKEMDPNFEDVHNNLFTDMVQTATLDIADFANNDLSVDDSAIEEMQTYVETFGKEYQNGKYTYTIEAEKALEKLSAQREVVAKKNKALEEFFIGLDFDKISKGLIVNDGSEKNNVGVAKTPNETSLQSNAGETRIRSDHNLLEELRLDRLRLDVMRKMDLITQEEYDQNMPKLDPSAKLEDSRSAAMFVEQAEGGVKDTKAYQNNLVNAMVSADLINRMTPELTVVAYDNLQTRIKESLKKDKQADVSQEAQALNNVRKTMDTLEADFRERNGYFLLDVTNGADAYDGYNHMFETRQKELDAELNNENSTLSNAEKAEKQAKLNAYKNSANNLDAVIKNYDDFWNLPEKVDHPKNMAIDFNDRINKSSKILDGLEFGEETLGKEVLERISRFQFKNDKGEVIPQFVDAKDPQKKSSVWKEGMVVDPESRLATVLKMAGNDIIMRDLGSKEKLSKESFTEELKGNIDFKLFEIYNSEETIRGAIEDPEKFTKKKDQYLQEFEAKLNNPEIPLAISDLGYNAAMDVQTNNTEVFANRLNQKLGKSNAEYVTAKLFENVSKIDRKTDSRGRSSKKVKSGAMKRALFGVAMGGSMAYIGSRLVTNAAATGGASAVAGTALALGVAVGAGITATAVQVWSRKKAAKREGTKYGWKEFRKDKMFWASVATTSLACASAALAATQAPELAIPAASCAIASFGIGTGLRFAQPYRDMRLKGHGKVMAFALGAANAAAVLVGGHMGRQDGLNDIGPSQKETTTFKAVRDNDSKTYSDEHIAKVTERNNANSTWEYRGEGPHDISAYRDSENYSNEAWWSQDQHDKAINAMKEQMPKLGWKEGAGNEEVMLRKLAAFERLHRNGDYQLPDGETITQKFGDLKGLLNGLLEGNLSPEGAKQLDNIQFNVGEDGHSKVLDSLGKDLYSYQDHPHGVEVEANFRAEPTTHIEDVPANTSGGGVFGWVSSSWNKFKKAIRPGTKADQVAKAQKPKPEMVAKIVEPSKPMVAPIVAPKKTIEKPAAVEISADKMLLDEYKIVYGVEPNMEAGKDKQWKDYCNRVEEERKVAAPKSGMNDFLLQRRKALDEMVMNNVVSENDVTNSDKPIRKDYMAKQVKDDRGHAGVVMEARQNLMQSNLTKDNFTNKITLSHFTKFMKHFINKDSVVADGSRDIHLNPVLKDKFKSEKSNVIVTDLNQYLVEGKPLEESRQTVSGKDARTAMSDINKAYVQKGNNR